jgi:rhodanese-related sulfurtransferase
MAEKINRNEVQTLAKNGAQLIEVLGSKQYAWAHLPQAINMPLWELDAKNVAAAGFSPDRSLVVYCHDYQ